MDRNPESAVVPKDKENYDYLFKPLRCTMQSGRHRKDSRRCGAESTRERAHGPLFQILKLTMQRICSFVKDISKKAPLPLHHRPYKAEAFVSSIINRTILKS